jgi:hypothetical protein
MGKVGYSRINQGLEGKWDPTRSLHKKDLWDWVFTAAYGVTWHADPNFSVNLYGEFSPTPDRYLGEIYDFLKDPAKSNMPMVRIVLSLRPYRYQGVLPFFQSAEIHHPIQTR